MDVGGVIYHALSRANFRCQLFRSSEKWVSKAVAQFGLENTMRNRGRPKKCPGHLFPNSHPLGITPV
jgi:hypothetical protein